MPYKSVEIRRQRQAEAARRRRAEGKTRGDAGKTRLTVSPKPDGGDGSANPVIVLRLKMGLSRPAFAAAIGTTYNQTSAVECGYQRSIPSKWWAPLTRLGVDLDKLETEYAVWQRKRAEALEAALKEVRHEQ
jgi:hypothetical protein